MNATCKCLHTSGFAWKAGYGSLSCFRGLGQLTLYVETLLCLFLSIKVIWLLSASCSNSISIMWCKGNVWILSMGPAHCKLHFMSAEQTCPFGFYIHLESKLQQIWFTTCNLISVFRSLTIQGSVQYNSAQGNDTWVSLKSGCFYFCIFERCYIFWALELLDIKIHSG